MDKGETMDTTTMFDAFDEHALEEHRTKYAEEAQRKWGATAVSYTHLTLPTNREV